MYPLNNQATTVLSNKRSNFKLVTRTQFLLILAAVGKGGDQARMTQHRRTNSSPLEKRSFLPPPDAELPLPSLSLPKIPGKDETEAKTLVTSSPPERQSPRPHQCCRSCPWSLPKVRSPEKSEAAAPVNNLPSLYLPSLLPRPELATPKAPTPKLTKAEKKKDKRYVYIEGGPKGVRSKGRAGPNRAGLAAGGVS